MRTSSGSARFGVVAFLVAVFAAACGGGSTGGTDPGGDESGKLDLPMKIDAIVTADADDPGTVTDEAPVDVQADTAIEDPGTVVPDVPVDPGPTDPGPTDPGPKDVPVQTSHVPFTSHGYTFTQDECPDGLSWLDGKWRFFMEVQWDEGAGAYKVTSPSDEETIDIFTFDGQSFVENISGDDNGTHVDAVNKGWFFCSVKAEFETKQKIFMFESVKPEGAFGNSSGDNYPCDILTDVTQTRFLLGCNYEWDPKNPWPGQFEYAKCVDDTCKFVR